MVYPGNASYYEYSREVSGRQVTDHMINPTNYPGVIGSGLYESDEFRMYGFKIKKCPRARSHDWTLCPFAHRAEKAKRRDPLRYNYEPVPCPDYRDDESTCARGLDCPYAHGVFEYWLHPAKYHTRACNLRPVCERKVCFFSHSPEELRDESEAKRLHMLRLNMNTPSIPYGSTSDDVSPDIPIVATNRNVGNEGTRDFMASLSRGTTSDKDERSSLFLGNFKTCDVVPRTTMVVTDSNFGNEGTGGFMGSSSRVTISNKNEGFSYFAANFTTLDVFPKPIMVATNTNVGNEGTSGFMASSIRGNMTMSDKDQGSSRFLEYFNTLDVVPRTTTMATNNNVGNEGTNAFVASSSGVNISGNDGGNNRFYGRFKVPDTTKMNDGNEETIDFLASCSGLTISGEDGVCNDFYGECKIDWIGDLFK